MLQPTSHLDTRGARGVDIRINIKGVNQPGHDYYIRSARNQTVFYKEDPNHGDHYHFNLPNNKRYGGKILNEIIVEMYYSIGVFIFYIYSIENKKITLSRKI